MPPGQDVPDYYAIVGLQPDATPAEIDARFRDISKEAQAKGVPLREMGDVGNAFRVLVSTKLRTEYHQQLGYPPPSTRQTQAQLAAPLADEQSPYAVLGVAPDADRVSLLRARKAAEREAINSGLAEDAVVERREAIEAAYEALTAVERTSTPSLRVRQEQALVAAFEERWVARQIAVLQGPEAAAADRAIVPIRRATAERSGTPEAKLVLAAAKILLAMPDAIENARWTLENASELVQTENLPLDDRHWETLNERIFSKNKDIEESGEMTLLRAAQLEAAVQLIEHGDLSVRDFQAGARIFLEEAPVTALTEALQEQADAALAKVAELPALEVGRVQSR